MRELLSKRNERLRASMLQRDNTINNDPERKARKRSIQCLYDGGESSARNERAASPSDVADFIYRQALEWHILNLILKTMLPDNADLLRFCETYLLTLERLIFEYELTELIKYIEEQESIESDNKFFKSRKVTSWPQDRVANQIVFDEDEPEVRKKKKTQKKNNAPRWSYSQ